MTSLSRRTIYGPGAWRLSSRVPQPWSPNSRGKTLKSCLETPPARSYIKGYPFWGLCFQESLLSFLLHCYPGSKHCKFPPINYYALSIIGKMETSFISSNMKGKRNLPSLQKEVQVQRVVEISLCCLSAYHRAWHTVGTYQMRTKGIH